MHYALSEIITNIILQWKLFCFLLFYKVPLFNVFIVSFSFLFIFISKFIYLY